MLQHTAVDMQTGLVDGGRLALAEALPQAEAGRQALRRRRGARAAVPERGRRGRGCWRRGDPLTLKPGPSSVSMPACITSRQLLMSPSMAKVSVLAGGVLVLRVCDRQPHRRQPKAPPWGQQALIARRRLGTRPLLAQGYAPKEHWETACSVIFSKTAAREVQAATCKGTSASPIAWIAGQIGVHCINPSFL